MEKTTKNNEAIRSKSGKKVVTVSSETDRIIWLPKKIGKQIENDTEFMRKQQIKPCKNSEFIGGFRNEINAEMVAFSF